MQRILIIKVSSLGDIVHTLPVVADIRRRHPDAQIDWLVEESFADLVRLVIGVRHVIPFALRRWRKRLFCRSTWREISEFRRSLQHGYGRYDAVIDCQGLIKTAWAGRLARGPLIGLNNRTHGAGYEWPVRFFYNRCISVKPHTHVVERSRQLVAAALGDPPLSSDPNEIDFGLDTKAAATALSATSFNLAAQATQYTRYIVFVHASSRADKRWPQQWWIELGQALAQRGIAIVLPWGNDAEHSASESIAQACGAAAFVPPRLTLPAIVGLIDRAAMTVGVDTGLVHIAAALRRPTIELYHFDTAWRTGGYWSPHIIHLGSKAKPAQLDEVKQALNRFGLL